MELDVIRDIGQMLLTTLDLRELLQKVAESSHEVLRADIVILYEYKAEEDRFIVPPVIVGELKEPGPMDTLIYENDIAARLLARGEHYYARDAQHDEFYLYSRGEEIQVCDGHLAGKRFLVREGIVSSAGLVLQARGESLGGMFINFRAYHDFDQEERSRIEIFAQQATLAILNTRLVASLDERTERLTILSQEKKKALDALREEQRKTIAAERLAAVNAIAAELAHRMNNVVGTIPVRVKQISELLDPSDLQYPKIVHFLDSISADASGILRTAQAIRSATTSEESLELVDVAILVSTAIKRIAVSAGIEIHNKCNKDLPKVLVFSGQFIDTLENLIRNGVEAIEESGSITIAARTLVKEERDWVVIDIEDTGCGIPPGDMPRLFELFFSTKGGMGFGLWRAKTLVESLGGKITLSSEIGKGTTVTILLPVTEVQG